MFSSLDDLEHTLQTERLLVEPLLASHAPEAFAALKDSQIYRFIPQDAPDNEQALAKRYEFLSARHSPDDSEIWLNWLLRLKETRLLIGHIEISIPRDGDAYLAYIIFPAYWRLGFAKEACLCVIRFLWNRSALLRLFASMDTRNYASIRLVESLGFSRAEFIPAADYFKGESSDEYQYVLKKPLENDW